MQVHLGPRSVHDISKQKYDSKKYVSKVWEELAEWVQKKAANLKMLTSFTDDDKEFIHIVSKCLWTLSTLTNLPWGRKSVQPSVHLVIPDFEKVLARSNKHSVVFFFLVSVCFVHMLSQTRNHTGLGLCLWDPSHYEQVANDVAAGFPIRDMVPPPQVTPQVGSLNNITYDPI